LLTVASWAALGYTDRHTVIAAAPQHAVAEGPAVAWVRPRPHADADGRGALPAQPGAGRSGIGEFGDEGTKVLPGDAGEAGMSQGRTDPCWSSHPDMIVRPCSCTHDSSIIPSRWPVRTTSFHVVAC